MIRKQCPALASWMREPAEPAPLWRLEMIGPDGTKLEAGPDYNMPGLDVSVEARAGGGGLRRCSLHAGLPEGWTVARVDFPIISGVSTDAARTAVVPFGWGMEYRLDAAVSYEGTYPSCTAAMQFAAFCGTDRSLYIGMHDPHGGRKRLRVSSDGQAAALTFSYYSGADESAGGVFDLPYETVIGTVDGGYYEAAQVYQEFTFEADWGHAGPVSKRPIPQWLKDTELWLRIKPELSPEIDPETFIRAAEYFGVPTAIHWYRWHQIPYDTLYPEYFPPREGFVEGIHELQSAGLRVMPYINGRLCDPNSATWQEGGSAWAARDENGEPYTEVYGSQVPLHPMCPSTPQWQEKIAALVDRLTNECGVDGVYIDQISAAAAMLCYDSRHPHSPGGGHFWADGYRALLDQARGRVAADRILTSEENAECWIDQLDALLIVNTPNPPHGRPVPLFPAVYSGRAITFAFQYVVADDLKQGLPFRSKMAHAFVYGAQLGWVAAGWIMAPESAREAEFLRSLARCRRFAHEFVVTGRFLGLLDARGDNPALSCEAAGSFGGTYQLETPAVIASAWLAEDGTLGVLIANMSGEGHEVEITLPLEKAGFDPSSEFTLRTFGPEGLLATEQCASPTRKVRIVGLGAMTLEVRSTI